MIGNSCAKELFLQSISLVKGLIATIGCALETNFLVEKQC